ncbi:E3 SUMO-protein ligase ZBED1 [Chaetodon auriga]|uniref:E3 SUMO-protein ligase ZBED1 n=1 Tax=Chaetodon auriga TaxID=39042 RepID=UPI004032B67B
MAVALVPKPNVTSPLWEHFGFQPNEKGEPANLDEAVCKLCGKKIQVKRGNTSNLRSHLASYHPALEARLPPHTPSRAAAHVGASRQLGVGEAFARVAKYSIDSDRHKRLTDAVTRYLVEEMVPFATVEKPAFTSLLQKFDKQYELPGKTYFSETAVPKMYNTNHTADNIAEALRSALDEWSLDEKKLACITTDNGANITAASWLKRTDLARAQAELQIPQHGLIMDCPTRWGSKQKMVGRVLEQTPAIKRVLDDRRHQHLIPSWQDIAVLELVNAALKPAAEFTDLLSGESYVTVSSIKPVLKLLTEDVLKPSDEDTTLTSDIKQKMCSVLEEKYRPAALQKTLAKACLLDPRYRGNSFDDDTEETKCALIEEILDTEGGGSGASASAAAQQESSAQTAVPPAAKKKTLGDLLKSRTTTSATIPKRVRANTELTRYLLEDPIDSNADPLAWWRDNQGRFPLLSKIARKYMCICATSAPSERVFSAAGNIVTPLRSSLKPHKVNMLVFLARNKDMTQI